MSIHFDIAMSIGATCRIKYQLKRYFPDRVQSSVFDWQVTPTSALLTYLERDFQGLFEPLDLALTESGIVRNTRFDTLHPHEFPKRIQSTADILANYINARQRHNYLAEKTRSLLRMENGTLLLGLSDPLTDAEIEQILDAISRFNPELKFMILLGVEDKSENWKGSDDLWSDHFAAALCRGIDARVAGGRWSSGK